MEVARGEPLRLRLKDPKCRLFIARTRRYSPEQEVTIQEKIQKLIEREVIESSTSACPVACVTVWEEDDSLRRSKDYRGWNELLQSYDGRLRDLRTMHVG